MLRCLTVKESLRDLLSLHEAFEVQMQENEPLFRAASVAHQQELQEGLCRLARPEDLIIYKLVSTRPRDHEDAAGVVRRQGDALDDRYILQWLELLERALDDSTLVGEFRGLRGAI